MAELRRACRIEDVEPGRARGVVLDGLGIAIFRDGDTFHALLGRCPHAHGVMGDGWVEDGEAVCPSHRWRFRLTTGRCTTVRGESLHRFACEVREGFVWVAV